LPDRFHNFQLLFSWRDIPPENQKGARPRASLEGTDQGAPARCTQGGARSGVPWRLHLAETVSPPCGASWSVFPERLVAAKSYAKSFCKEHGRLKKVRESIQPSESAELLPCRIHFGKSFPKNYLRQVPKAKACD
jgi:hypothetical protein